MPPKDNKPRYIRLFFGGNFFFNLIILELVFFSKKAVQAKQAKVIEDSTFGLKNKNKSKKVQEYITRVEKTVKHSQGNFLLSYFLFLA